jgi:hypothetical protein
VDLNDFTKNNVCNFSSDIQDGIKSPIRAVEASGPVLRRAIR